MKKIIALLILMIFCSFIFANSFINTKLDEQWDLLNDLELEMNNIRMMISSLQKDNLNLTIYSESLEKRIEVCNVKITEMQETIESMRKALLSNKEDTHEVINILGDMVEELDDYKTRLSEMELKIKRTNTFVQILIPTLSVPMIMNGVYLYINGNDKDYAKFCMSGGTVVLIGAELIWNGGKFILKLW